LISLCVVRSLEEEPPIEYEEAEIDKDNPNDDKFDPKVIRSIYNSHY